MRIAAVIDRAGLPEKPKTIHLLAAIRTLRVALAITALLASGVFPATESLAQHLSVSGGKTSGAVARSIAQGRAERALVVLDVRDIDTKFRADTAPERETVLDRAAVEARATEVRNRKNAVLGRFTKAEVEVMKDYSHLPVLLLNIQSQEALHRLEDQADVMSIREDQVVLPFLAESLPLIHQPAVVGDSGAGTTVAVIDTGVDYRRSAFGSCSAPGPNCKVVFAKDFAPEDGTPDADGHGTNVAGIVLGVAPGTKILGLDVFEANDTAYSSMLGAA